MKQKLLLSLILLIFAAPCFTLAQQGNIVSGGEASGSGGSMSYSIGQTDYLTFSSSTGSLSLGLQQSFFEAGLTVPQELLVQNVTINSGESLCFNATQTVVLAGDGTDFIVQPGGSAEVIAGVNIILKSGFHAHSEAVFRAWITTDESYCYQQPNLLANAETYLPAEEFAPEKIIEARSFRVFPNPTTGEFRLELINYPTASNLNISIYNMQGRLILSETPPHQTTFSFNLGDYQSGIYIIRVISDDEISSAKIIKQ